MAGPSQQPSLWAAEMVTFAAATVFIGLRFLSRRLTKVQFWWDDLFALLAYAVAVAVLIITPVWMNKGGFGLHIQDVPGMTEAEAVRYTKLVLYVYEILYAFALFFAKVAILLFYWRMFRVNDSKFHIQILLGCCVVWIIFRTFMAIFHCVPVNAFWDTNVKNAVCNINDRSFFLGTVAVHIALDLCILALPVMQVRRLQLPKMQRLGIMFMFGFGVFICVAAVVIMVESAKLNTTSNDVTWNLAGIIVWASVEVNLVSVSVCMPTVRPAFLFLTGRRAKSALGSDSNSYPTSYSRSQGTKRTIALHSRKQNEQDESSSTHELAGPNPNGGDNPFDHEVEHYQGNTNAFASGPSNGVTSNFNNPVSHQQQGIMVKNETIVQVEVRNRD